MTTHLIIPDPHADPDHSLSRFAWLGEMIADVKPDTVVCIGDWADMPSLCSYDKGKGGFQNRRYAHDVSSAITAQELMFLPLKKRKKKLPRFVMMKGNHDHRIERAISLDAVQLEGVISPKDLAYEAFGWEVVDYQGSSPGMLEIDGIIYSHYFTSGVLGTPISGLHPAYSMVTKKLSSCVAGHSHTTDYCVRSNASGDFVQGLVVGCYIDYFADFAGQSNSSWWRGVVVLHGVDNGQYDPQWIGIDRIKEAYS